MLGRCVAEIDSVEGVASTSLPSSLTDILTPCDHASHSGDNPVHDTNSHSGHDECYHTCSTLY